MTLLTHTPSTVGRSFRTPAKHGILCAMLSSEVAVAGYLPPVHWLLWLDLTAGDGIPADDLPWNDNCSPGIMASRARRTTKPLLIALWENKAETFQRLLQSLEDNLPGLGYKFDGVYWRYHTHVRLQAINGRGGEDLDYSVITKNGAVFTCNDPNLISDWALRPGFATAVEDHTPWFRNLSTMGCNVNGLKRTPRRERDKWFQLVTEQENALPAHRDLLIVKIDKDDSCWGYLICEPVKWRAKIERAVSYEFRKIGRTVTYSWFRENRPGYEKVKQDLFLTHKERRHSS